MDTVYWQQVLPCPRFPAGERSAIPRRAGSSRSTTVPGTGSMGPPFVAGAGTRPPGAELYPPGHGDGRVRARGRGLARQPGGLCAGPTRSCAGTAPAGCVAVPYHEAYAGPMGRAAAKLREAAKLAEDTGLRQLPRAARPGTRDRRLSAERPGLDRHEDRTASTSSSGRSRPTSTSCSATRPPPRRTCCSRTRSGARGWPASVACCPALQRGLPVPAAYKRESRAPTPTSTPTTPLLCGRSQRAAPRPSPSICPTTKQVQLRKGTRRLQLKNAMRAKFDKHSGADRRRADRRGPAVAASSSTPSSPT